MKLTDSITDHNDDIDLVSILGVAAFVFFILFTGFYLYKSGTFDPLAYATGSGLLIAGVGGAYRLKCGATPKTPV